MNLFATNKTVCQVSSCHIYTVLCTVKNIILVRRELEKTWNCKIHSPPLHRRRYPLTYNMKKPSFGSLCMRFVSDQSIIMKNVQYYYYVNKSLGRKMKLILIVMASSQTLGVNNDRYPCIRIHSLTVTNKQYGYSRSLSGYHIETITHTHTHTHTK